MGAFWTDAERIFEAARAAENSGCPSCDMAIILKRDGAIQMVDAAGWVLPSLQESYGARAVYRVTRKSGRVRVEGRSGSQTCLLETQSAAAAARQLLNFPKPTFHQLLCLSPSR